MNTSNVHKIKEENRQNSQVHAAVKHKGSYSELVTVSSKVTSIFMQGNIQSRVTHMVKLIFWALHSDY